MNVLTLVMTMLMLFSILTFTRLKTFLDFNAVQHEYQSYIIKDKLIAFNEIQKDYYDTLRGAPKEKTGTQPTDDEDYSEDDEPRKPLRAVLSFDYFLDKKWRNDEKSKFQQNREIFKRLMEYLYSKHEFFIKLKESRPDYIDEILDRLVELSDKDIISEKIKTKEEIANIHLMDDKLEEAFYKMLKGTREKIGKGNEFIMKDGYPSLLEFISVKKGKKPISVYLASGEILMALYGNEKMVEDLLEKRYELFKQVKKNGTYKDEAKRLLTSSLQGKSIFGNNEADVIDFSISKTNPSLYQ